MNLPGQPGCLHSSTEHSPGVIDVIHRFSGAFWERYGNSIHLDQRKALQAILQCRTPDLGGQRYTCAHCSHIHFAWHSCNHRLCPQCGSSGTAQWVQTQLAKLLPVPYFMVTFTLPQPLHGIIHCQRDALELFFQDSSRALTELLADPKRTRFHRSGFFGVYQSWKQDMGLHPHIHYIVPGAGLSENRRAVLLKDPTFLIHAQPLATRLRTLLTNHLLEKGLIDTTLYWQLLKTNWNASVDHAGSGENAVKYLGRYVQRSVISDSRILAIEQDHVTIRVRSNDSESHQTLCIDGVEFIRRFLLHALPTGFHRIRHRGFLHSKAKKSLLWLQTMLGTRLNRRVPQPRLIPSGYTCPHCGNILHLTARLARAPPGLRNHHFFQTVAA